MSRVIAAVRIAIGFSAILSPSLAIAEDTCTRRTGTLYVERECGGLQAIHWIRFDCSESGAHVHTLKPPTWEVKPDCRQMAE
jgi:hypothetical protein